MSQKMHYSEQEDTFRKLAYTFANADTPRLTAILRQMRVIIPTLNTKGGRLNIKAEQIHEKDLRSSIYVALCENPGLLTDGSNAEIIQTACYAYLDNIIYAGV